MKNWIRFAAAAASVLALAACAPKIPEANSGAGMTRLTFVIHAWIPESNEELNIQAHTTIYLETVEGNSLFNIDGNSGASDVFPFDVRGNAPGNPNGYPYTPIRQNVYFDYKDGTFTLSAKATATAQAGAAMRCSVEDISGNEVGHSNTVFFKNSPLDTLTVGCSY